MKPYKFVLPVLAVAALGLSFPALAGQAETSKEARKSEVKVGPISVTTLAQNPPASSVPAVPVPPRESNTLALPSITIDGIKRSDLQTVLNEALSFKGSDAEFAKKAEEWKRKYGMTVTRKGQGHITLAKGEGSQTTHIEIHRSNDSSSVRKSVAPKSRTLESTDGIKILRSDAKSFSISPRSDLKIELKELADVKAMSAKERAEFEKTILEIKKDLKESEKYKILELSDRERISVKTRAGLEKERNSITIRPGDAGSDVVILRRGAEVKGLSEADRKNMDKELAKVRAEADKKIEAIMKKYSDKAKKSAK